MGYLIGVDVGSQSVKAVLCTPDGTTRATASAPCTMTHPHSGWADQDPAQWRDSIAVAVRSVLAQTDLKASEVSHLALACQVDGVVPIDSAAKPLRAAIIWLDRRASTQAAQLVARLGADRIFALSGLNADSSHIAPKLMWLRDEQPRLFEQASELPPVAGYLVGWLTGSTAQDHANASSTLLYDVRTRAWSSQLLAAADIDPALLTPIVAAHDTVGPLTDAAAEAVGLSTGCIVLAGTGDDHAAALGAGVMCPGAIADVTGTAEPVAAAADAPVFDSTHLVETHAHAVDGVFLIENPGFVSGGSTLWLANTLRAEQGEVFDWAGEAPIASDGVIFLPALSGAMAPRWNDAVRGGFYGLGMNHDHRQMCRAVLEGCAFALRDITDRLCAIGVGGSELRVVGGGRRSPLWLQIKADVTGLPARPVLNQEPTALGAAMLAGIGGGMFADAQQAVDACVQVADSVIEPDPAATERYAAAYARYRQLFDAVEGIDP